jgi:hypothetical protein
VAVVVVEIIMIPILQELMVDQVVVLVLGMV